MQISRSEFNKRVNSIIGDNISVKAKPVVDENDKIGIRATLIVGEVDQAINELYDEMFPDAPAEVGDGSKQ